MGSRDDYRFLKITDAFASLNQKVNLIGIIVEHSFPTRSKGSDWYCCLRIVDESHHSRGLLVNVFTETMEKLPQVESSGDIIQLSHVLMKTHNKEIYALFNKKLSSFALYEGKYGERFTPYQISSKFRPREQDKTFVADLRKWLDVFQLDTVSKESVPLRQIKEGEHLDVVCKVLHICRVNEDECMLFVWDGTDAPSLQIQTKLELEKDNPLPLQLENWPLSKGILSTFPTVGTVLSISVSQGNEKLNLSSLCPGRWVKFINLTFDTRAGLWWGILMPFTRIRLVPMEDRLIQERELDFEKRFSSRWDRMPFTSFPWPSRITDIDNEDVPFVTLMDIITFTEVTAKFKTVARVVAALPWKAEDFRSPSGVYRVRLTLEDPTARIHAYIYAEDGETFFEGNPPIAALIRKLNKLLGLAEGDTGSEVQDGPWNPPWVQCCIKSYYQDENDVWGSRKYRIFGTRLLC